MTERPRAPALAGTLDAVLGGEGATQPAAPPATGSGETISWVVRGGESWSCSSYHFPFLHRSTVAFPEAVLTSTYCSSSTEIEKLPASLSVQPIIPGRGDFSTGRASATAGTKAPARLNAVTRVMMTARVLVSISCASFRGELVSETILAAAKHTGKAPQGWESLTLTVWCVTHSGSGHRWWHGATSRPAPAKPQPPFANQRG